ncbi:PLP-dependent aminotransferase family protein [Bacillus siamensis]|uniref:PLP-dependent aminotransferase family protein n=1 Tax=Bacillus siamensis TaxID=659243 RepID=A0AAI8HKY3_9BACI|nr:MULTISPECIES: PLP-dependent aminotransferase family protein [Bacillus]AME07354.1 aminotransferase [Bacillus sp. SDLI1]AUJ75935.1 PLP-dependent aminotransferase family protein [Bacillus siamensis]UUA83691.1 PLP-dependent aminotransferase family protein [Bacillus siamensis]
MQAESFFSDHVKKALTNDPPGEWMPAVPKACIPLHSGYPDPALVPAKELKEAASRLLDEERDLPLHYMGSPKPAVLKKQIQERLSFRGIRCRDDELLVTSGACQAIDLAARVFLDEQTAVAAEAPAYMEALEIFKNYTPHMMSIPADQDGLQTETLAFMLEERKRKGLVLPRLLYTIPAFQNPAGTVMSAKRRTRLLQLADTYNFLILEDDAYGELGFTDIPLSLKAMDQNGRVLYAGSFSKVIAPGLRIGWIAGDAAFIKALSWFKKDLDHPFSQAVTAVYLEQTNVEERLAALRKAYRSKRDVLIAALKQYLPESASWHVPDGGYFVWVKVPGADTSALLERALSHGVSYVPGKYFFQNQEDGAEYLRLSFSYAGKAALKEGVQRLGRLLENKV